MSFEFENSHYMEGIEITKFHQKEDKNLHKNILETLHAFFNPIRQISLL